MPPKTVRPNSVALRHTLLAQMGDTGVPAVSESTFRKVVLVLQNSYLFWVQHLMAPTSIHPKAPDAEQLQWEGELRQRGQIERTRAAELRVISTLLCTLVFSQRFLEVKAAPAARSLTHPHNRST